MTDAERLKLYEDALMEIWMAGSAGQGYGERAEFFAKRTLEKAGRL